METHERQQSILGAVSHAISQEGHILTQRPDLFYQQIHNRLSWASTGGKAAGKFKELLKEPHPTPWIASGFPPRESKNVVKILQGHTAPVNGCAIDRTGKFALSAGADGTIRIWEMASSSVSFEMNLGTTLYCCDWSPQSDLFAAGDRYGTIYLFQTGQAQPRELSGHEDYIYCCTFDPSGKYLLTGSGDRTIRLWDLTSSKEINVYKGHESGIIQLKFSRDGQTFVSTANDNTVAVWGVQSGNVIGKHKEEYLPIQAVAISRDNQFLLTCGANRMVTLWDYPNLQSKNQVKADQKVFNACDFSPDGRFFAYSGDNDLVVGSIADLATVATFSGHSKQIKDFSFSPDGKIAISASLDQTLRLWQLNFAGNVNEASNSTFEQSRFYVPGNTLLTSDDEGKFVYWNTATGYSENQFPTLDKGIAYFNFDLSGRLLISCDQEQKIRLWNPENNQNVLSIAMGHPQDQAEVLITKNQIVALSRGLHLKFVDTNTGRPLSEFQADKFQISPDETKLAFSYGGFLNHTSLSLVNTSNQKKVADFIGHVSAINDFRFTHQSDRLISAGADKTVRVWDCYSFSELLAFKEHTSNVITLSISPDDSLALSLDDHGELILWRLNDGKVYYRIHTKIRSHGECFFSPDMTLIIYGGDSNWVNVHRIEDGKPIAAIPTFSGIEEMTLHPYLPQLTGVDSNGNLYLHQLKNIHYGPIILTPYEINGGLSYLCPACQKSPIVKQQLLGQVIQCATESCGLPIKLNAFTTQVVVKTEEKPKRGLFSKR